MKKLRFIIAILAVALVLGLTACGGNDGGPTGNGGGSGIRLYRADYNHSVSFPLSGARSDLNKSDFELTIDETPVTISLLISYGGDTSLYFRSTSMSLTVGMSYTVRIRYTGSVVAPFTRTGTVVCRDARDDD